jgi:WD40 repeat protein
MTTTQFFQEVMIILSSYGTAVMVAVWLHSQDIGVKLTVLLYYLLLHLLHHFRVISEQSLVPLIRDSWDLIERQAVMTLTGHSAYVYSVTCISHDRILSGGEEGTVRLWDVITGDCLRVMTGHTAIVSNIAVLSYDIIAASSFDRTISIWQVSIGQQLQILSAHQSYVYGLSVLSDGRLVSAGNDSTLRIWS